MTCSDSERDNKWKPSWSHHLNVYKSRRACGAVKSSTNSITMPHYFLRYSERLLGVLCLPRVESYAHYLFLHANININANPEPLFYFPLPMTVVKCSEACKRYGKMAQGDAHYNFTPFIGPLKRGKEVFMSRINFNKTPTIAVCGWCCNEGNGKTFFKGFQKETIAYVFRKTSTHATRRRRSATLSVLNKSLTVRRDSVILYFIQITVRSTQKCSFYKELWIIRKRKGSKSSKHLPSKTQCASRVSKKL